jgi:hypothetical protein
MLNAHSAIAVPHPPHIMKFFGPLELHYGNLSDDGNFRRLIADVCRMVELHTYPWEIKPDRDLVFRKAPDRTLLAVYFQIYDQYRAYTGKRRWACKSTFMIEYVNEILRYHPDARFIYMVRDGRDVAVSARKSIFNHFHVFYTAKRWQREQQSGLEWLATLPHGQITLLKYEELITEPESVIRRLCEFLGEEFEEKMLEYHRSQEARKSGSLSVSWENTSKPVIRENAHKYRKQLSQKEILQFEAIAFRELHALGYQTDNPEEVCRKHDALTKERISYRLAEFRLKAKAEANHLLRDKNSRTRLKKQLFIASIGVLRRFTTPHA